MKNSKVSIAEGSVHVVFSKCIATDECFNLFDYKVEEFQDNLHEVFPTVYPSIRWVGRNDCAIASNKFAFFGVSERDGCVSIWCLPREVKQILKPIRDKWIAAIGKSFTMVALKSFPDSL